MDERKQQLIDRIREASWEFYNHAEELAEKAKGCSGEDDIVITIPIARGQRLTSPRPVIRESHTIDCSGLQTTIACEGKD